MDATMTPDLVVLVVAWAAAVLAVVETLATRFTAGIPAVGSHGNHVMTFRDLIEQMIASLFG
jgi:hypothetical protein